MCELNVVLVFDDVVLCAILHQPTADLKSTAFRRCSVANLHATPSVSHGSKSLKRDEPAMTQDEKLGELIVVAIAELSTGPFC
jgi:hypothetical protein